MLPSDPHCGFFTTLILFVSESDCIGLALWVLLVYEPGSTLNHQSALAMNLVLSGLLAVAIGNLEWRLLALVLTVTTLFDLNIYGIEDFDSVPMN